MEVQLNALLISVLDGGRWSASTPRYFTLVKAPGTHWTGGWVDPRGGVDVVMK